MLVATELINSSFFNESFYRTTYEEVDNAVIAGQFQSGLDHFIQVGQFEGLDPIPLFDTDFYLRQNPEVASAVEGSDLTAYEHFVKFGQFEPERDPSALFDTSYYLESNPGVAEAVEGGVLSAIEHYILFGEPEGRFPLPPPPGDILGTADSLGVLSAPIFAEGVVGSSDRADLYGFNLEADSNVNLTLNITSPESDADLQLIQDLNGNGLVDGFQEVLAESVLFNSTDVPQFGITLPPTPDAISGELPAGEYFVRVLYAPNAGIFGDVVPSTNDASYNLEVSVG